MLYELNKKYVASLQCGKESEQMWVKKNNNLLGA